MADLNPLTGRPLEAWQRLIVGPASTWNPFDQGPRRTVVDTRPGAALPSWIQRLDVPLDTGAYLVAFNDTGQPGGSYQPIAQQLPELVTTAPRLEYSGVSWGPLLVLLLLGAIAFSRGRA